MCERNLIAQVDAERGKPRSWLLKSFSHHLLTERERSLRQKCCDDATHIHIDWNSAKAAYLAAELFAMASLDTSQPMRWPADTASMGDLSPLS